MLKPGVNLPTTTSKDDYILLAGGFDQITPTLQIKSGFARVMQNFECNTSGGYTRIAGYERTDGRPSPSDATYIAVTLTITGTIAVGDTIYGTTSAATGEVAYISGSLMVYTKAVGNLQVGESIKTPDAAGTVQATVTALDGAEETDDFDARMRYAAAEIYRADIGAVTGSGVIRGVIYYGGTLYAFRDNAGATALAIYKATTAGWALVPTPNTLSFTLGTAEYAAGATISKGGVSATVKRVCLESGTWLGGTAAGKIIIGAVTGGPFTAGVSAGGGACTLAGAETAVTLLPGGSVDFDIGTVGAERLVYVADGVNKAFEFNGDYVAPITTGSSPDVPSHVMVHQGHLFLSFDNSVQHSGIGEPFNYTALAGAGEFLADGSVTAMRVLPGQQSTGAAAICHEAGTQIVYGTAEPFQLVSYEDSAGVKAGTAQRLGQLFIMDDRGVMSMTASQNYGNFIASTLTANIRPWIKERRNLATASVVNREKNQYRLFFSDGSGLYATIANGKLLGMGTVYFPDKVRCACFGETPDGNETSFFGGDDGWVYRLDAGTSFDGEAIDYELTLVPANQGNPRIVKRYRKATFEIQSDYYAEFAVTFELAYSSTSREQQFDSTLVTSPLAGVSYDTGSTWDVLTWDGRALAPEDVEVLGSGENIVTRVLGSSAICQPFTLNSVLLTYSARKRLR